MDAEPDRLLDLEGELHLGLGVMDLDGELLLRLRVRDRLTLGHLFSSCAS